MAEIIVLRVSGPVFECEETSKPVIKKIRLMHADPILSPREIPWQKIVLTTANEVSRTRGGDRCPLTYYLSH